MNVQIEKLFNKNRLDGSVLQLLLLTFYTPIGLVLMVVRFFISLQLILAVTVMPRGATITRLVLRCLCGVLGLVVRQENLQNNPLYEDEDDLLAEQQQEQQLEQQPQNQTAEVSSPAPVEERAQQASPRQSQAGDRAKKRLVVLSNHVTPFDHFALSSVMPCVKLSCNGDGIPWPLSYLLGNQVVNLHPGPFSPPPPPSPTSLPPPPPRRDDIFLDKLKAFVNFGFGQKNANNSTSNTDESENNRTPTNSSNSDDAGNSASAGASGGSSSTTGGANNTSNTTGTSNTTTNASSRGSDGQYSEPNTRSYGLAGDADKKAAIDDSLPLLVFPEDCTTNGTVALMQYQPWALSVCGNRPSVVCVRVSRLPPLPLATSVLTSSFVQDLLTLFFCPFTVYTVRYMGRVARLPAESDGDFGRRLQALSGRSLGLETTTYDALEKVEYVKRCITSQRQQQQQHWAPAAPVGTSADLQTMGRQVLEVLPHLPLAAILRDIARTGNVDVTITNFLEGSVPDYTPPSLGAPPSPLSIHHQQQPPPQLLSSPQPPLQPSSSSGFGFSNPFSSSSGSGAPMLVSAASSAATSIGSMSANSSPINLCTKAQSFPRSANERMLSFHERKSLLLDNAVRKYIERFGLHGERDPYMKTTS